MIETDWLNGTEPATMLDYLQDRAGDRKLRLFAVACCRRAEHLFVDDRSRKAVEVAERFADRAATDEELEAAEQEAWNFTDHVVHNDEAFFSLTASEQNAADIPAWASIVPNHPHQVIRAAQLALGATEVEVHTELLRCIFGNPFCPMTVNPAWLAWEAGTIPKIAQVIYESRAFDQLPILADALEDAGCADADLLHHCRSGRRHVRGCWAVDLILGKS